MFDVDRRVLRFVIEHRTHGLDHVALRAAELDKSPWFFAVVVLALAGIAATRHAWRALVAVPVAVVVAEATSFALKQVVDQHRPPPRYAILHVGGLAMPSDHAAFTIAAVVALVLAVDWGGRGVRWAVAGALGILVVVIGALMVYAGVHWASDVVAGWALGAVVGVAADRATRAVWPRSEAPASAPA